MVKRVDYRELAIVIGTGFLAAIVYRCLLGYRPDYIGHFLAGYGGTLGALAGVLYALRDRDFDKAPAIIVLITLACLAIGAIGERTVFRIAIFDPVDLCNQSLGALLASAGLLGTLPADKPGRASSVLLAAWATLGLFAGTYYAAI